jgi:tetratricopeptide (TPR) repeat protein
MENMKIAYVKYIMAILLTIPLACGGPARKDIKVAAKPDPFTAYKAYDHFVNGDLYEQSGNLDAAVDEYRKALILDPTSAEIRRNLSEIYFQQQRYDEAAILRSEIEAKTTDDFNFIGDCMRFTKDFENAAKFYARSLELDSTQYVTRIYYARILEFLGQNDQAEKQYKAVVNYAPSKADALIDLAGFYLKLNKLDKGIETYSKAREADPQDVRPLIGMATVFLAKGDTLKADTLYMNVAEMNWDDSEVLVSLIPWFLSTEDLDGAEKVGGRIAELMPNDLLAQKRFAMILYGNEKFAKAESLFTMIIDQGDKDAAVFFYMARMKQESEDYPAAEQYFRKSLNIADTVTEAWINLAIVVDQQKRYQDAIDVMGQALMTIPEDSNAILLYTAILHGRNEHFDLAREGYLRLLHSNPDDIGLRFSLASADERLGNFEDAEKGFKWVLSKDSQNAMALNYLGYMYADKGVKLKESKELIEKALKIDPENGAYLDSYAWVLYKLGQYDEALVQMKKAVKTESEDPVVYDHQGDIYLALNQMELARECWSKALELKPEDETIRSKLYPR